MRVYRVFGGPEAVDHSSVDDGEESDDGARSSSESSSSSSGTDSSSSSSSSSESEGEEREEAGQLPANMPRDDAIASTTFDGEEVALGEGDDVETQPLADDAHDVPLHDPEDVEMGSNGGRSREPSVEREGSGKTSDVEMKSSHGSGSSSDSHSSSEDEKEEEGREKPEEAEGEVKSQEENAEGGESQVVKEKRRSGSGGGSSSSSSSSEDEGGDKGEGDGEKEVTAKDLFGADASDDSASSSGSAKQKKKRRRIRSDSGSSSGSDREKGASAPAGHEITVKDILGDISSDDDDVQVGEDEMKSPKRGDSEDEEPMRSPIRGDDHYEERETEDFGRGDDEAAAVQEPPEPPQEARIEAEIPRISANLGKDFFFVRFPNFLSVDPKPFDKEHYEDEIDEEETQDEEGRARLKLKVENTIRWRYGFDAEQNSVKESNAKIVRWSDGSMSLYLGSEIFDVYKQPLQNDYNHLFVRQGTGLMGQAVFRSKLSFRPHSTDSFTHRKITLSLADRSQKTQKIKVISEVGINPDANRWERIKKEEEKLRFASRIQQKVKRVKEKASGKGLTAGFLEGAGGKDVDDDEEGVSLTAIKNKYKAQAKAGAMRPSVYSSDSDSDIDKPKQRKQKRTVYDSDDEDGEKKGSGSGSGSERGSGSDSDASKGSKSSKGSKKSAGSKKSGSGSGSGSGSSSSSSSDSDGSKKKSGSGSGSE